MCVKTNYIYTEEKYLIGELRRPKFIKFFTK